MLGLSVTLSLSLSLSLSLYLSLSLSFFGQVMILVISPEYVFSWSVYPPLRRGRSILHRPVTAWYTIGQKDQELGQVLYLCLAAFYSNPQSLLASGAARPPARHVVRSGFFTNQDTNCLICQEPPTIFSPPQGFIFSQQTRKEVVIIAFMKELIFFKMIDQVVFIIICFFYK